jgi:hypothetical protein
MNVQSSWPLLGLAVSAIQMAVIIFELVVYLAMVRWYFAAGPVVARHRWQTPVALPEAGDAIETVLRGAKLAWRRSGDFFAVRRPWWEFSTYPRITLEIEPTPHGAAVTCKVKPFLSPLLFLAPGLALGTAPGDMARFLTLGLVALVIGAYAYFFLWEAKHLHAVAVLRDGLAGIGVRACRRCGYDLFGLEQPSACPECGAAG